MRAIGLACFLLTSGITQAEITTLKDADTFLEKYCIAIVNEIEKSFIKQNNQVFTKDWKGNKEVPIAELSDVYSKLCKRQNYVQSQWLQ